MHFSMKSTQHAAIRTFGILNTQPAATFIGRYICHSSCGWLCGWMDGCFLPIALHSIYICENDYISIDWVLSDWLIINCTHFELINSSHLNFQADRFSFFSNTIQCCFSCAFSKASGQPIFEMVFIL